MIDGRPVIQVPRAGHRAFHDSNPPPAQRLFLELDACLDDAGADPAATSFGDTVGKEPAIRFTAITGPVAEHFGTPSASITGPDGDLAVVADALLQSRGPLTPARRRRTPLRGNR